MNAFPDRIESLRKGITQRDFARKLGIPLNTYTNWVRGVRMPNVDAIINICTRLGVSADWLLGLSDNPAPNRQAPAALAQGSHNIAIGSATNSTITNGHSPTVEERLAALEQMIDQLRQ